MIVAEFGAIVSARLALTKTSPEIVAVIGAIVSASRRSIRPFCLSSLRSSPSCWASRQSA
jgi:hypothetical protein